MKEIKFKEGKRIISFRYNINRNLCWYIFEHGSSLEHKINSFEDFKEYIENVLNSEFSNFFPKTLDVEVWKEVYEQMSPDSDSIQFIDGKISTKK